MYLTVGACLRLQNPHTPCKSLPALPGVSHTLGLKIPGRCSGAWAEQGWKHMDCKIHPGKHGMPRSELSPTSSSGCSLKPPASRHSPARLAWSATCCQRRRSPVPARGQQQHRATNFLLLHRLSLSFNSSQTPDPKKQRYFPSCRRPTRCRHSSRC